MTDWKRIRDEAAERHRDEDIKNNPNGYIVTPYVNNQVTHDSFQAGYDYAIANDPRVKKMREALERIYSGAPCDVFAVCKRALKAFEGSGE